MTVEGEMPDEPPAEASSSPHEPPAASRPRESERPPLSPGRPRPLLGWLRGPAGRRLAWLPTWVRVVLWIVVTVALGTWGFSQLPIKSPYQLNLLQSVYRGFKLFTLDLGPAAGGSGSPKPNLQLWIALVLAALLVLRAVVAVARERLRRGATRYLLRDHVIVCGGGVHGTELVAALCGGRLEPGRAREQAPARAHDAGRLAGDEDQPHDVVLVDTDPGAAGMQAPRGRYEWRITGDSVLKETLLAAGVAHASWIIAVTGNDYVNSQIASTVQELLDEGRARDRVYVLVQVEDPWLTRFLEEDTEPVPREVKSSGSGRRPVMCPFSANTIAAEALLDTARRKDGTPLLETHDGLAPSILLAGDHPLLDVLVLAALRRWQEQLLGQPAAGAGGSLPPLHISVFGPDAVVRVERLQQRWRPPPVVAAIEATDAELSNEAALSWLRTEGRADHAFIVCCEEQEGVRLTLGVSRALGGDVIMTRVTTEPGSVLDDRVKLHTARSAHLATADVLPIAQLASDPRALGSLTGRDRLKRALTSARGEMAAEKLSDELFARQEIEIYSDSGWRISSCERELLEPLVEPVPLGALVRARLVVDLPAPASLRAIVTKLSDTDPDRLGFTAACLYARQLNRTAAQHGIAQLPTGGHARRVLRLRAESLRLGAERAGSTRRRPAEGRLAGHASSRVAIISGGVSSISELSACVTRELLERALDGFDGVILFRSIDLGVPGIVREVANELGIQAIQYPAGGRGGSEPEQRISGVGEPSVGEPLAMWTDIVNAGIPGSTVATVVFPGDETTLREILLARAVGAPVAWLDPASEETEALEDRLPLGIAGVLQPAADPMTVRAFLLAARPEPFQRALLDPDPREPLDPVQAQLYRLLERVAKLGHSDYRRRQRGRKSAGDAALAPWDQLVFTLKHSSLARASDIPNKLALIGKRLAPGGEPLMLSDDQRELLAEVEHGRWNIERLMSGWTVGERDVARKTSPYLVSWADLEDKIRQYDRDAVQNIAPVLEAAGWGVADLPAGPRAGALELEAGLDQNIGRGWVG